MPPKKKGETEEKMVLIGRMGTNLKVDSVFKNSRSILTFLSVVWYSWSA